MTANRELVDEVDVVDGVDDVDGAEGEVMADCRGSANWWTKWT